MTTILNKTVIFIALPLFLFPFFVAAATPAEELESLEREVATLNAEITRAEQGIAGGLSKQELSRNFQTILQRMATVVTQFPELADDLTALASSVSLRPSTIVISPTADQTIEGKKGSHFDIEWKTENWPDGTLADIYIARQGGDFVRARTGVQNKNGEVSSTTVNINSDATVSRTYQIRVSAAKPGGVPLSAGEEAVSGSFTIMPPASPTPTTCTYTYSNWSACSSLSNTQTRSIISVTPSGCSGTPVTSQSCAFSPTEPSITLLSPNNGETWTFGEKQKISWLKNGVIPPNAAIAAYIYKGSEISALYSDYASKDKQTGDMPPNSGYFEWTIPTNSPVSFIRRGGEGYRIKVVLAVDGRVIARDESDAPFTISLPAPTGGGQPAPVQPIITVISPNGGENITHGQLAIIKWESDLPETFNYNLTLLNASGSTVVREIDSTDLSYLA